MRKRLGPSPGTPLAAAALALTMVLAAGFHVMRREYALVPANLVLAAVAPALLTTRRVLTSLAVLVVIGRDHDRSDLVHDDTHPVSDPPATTVHTGRYCDTANNHKIIAGAHV